ncbi:rop guanine nucleotide exchange factor 9 isoform X1 [Triticum aestivum]|uniref:rop guanine nucleotide exchange factor 9 isoform X1 n=1 Tax=Triticum aestivum TaxID=4565 RepID=UPI001D029A6D|nr:rop guanine nucleotide exchange factor 9-like isoform X1 [Triticum aestivum]
MAPPFLKTGHGRDSRFSFRRRKSGKASSTPSSPLSSVSSSASSEDVVLDPGSPTMEPSTKTQTLPCARRMLSRSSCGSRGKLSVDLIPAPLAGGPSDAPRPSTSAAPPPKPAPRPEGPPSDMDMVKEKFSKLLLGEDMSGSGKGVSSALALSNAITNLAASVFGEQRRLQPMAPEPKARWTKEIDWLLSVTDFIVEFVPSRQVAEDGSTMEVMITQQRRDLLMNIPALRKLDGMLLDYLDSFGDKQEFWYVKKNDNESEKGDAAEQSDKWWLPTVKVPPEGLSDSTRRWLQHQKELVNQVLKATMAINANVLMEMDVPEAYMETLPKNGKSTLGDSMYKLITDDYFNPEELIATVDLSNEYNIVDLKNRIEASVVIWQKKMQRDGKWGHGVSHEKRGRFEGRAENVLLLLKHRFPGISQSALDISKIQYNRVPTIFTLFSELLHYLFITIMPTTYICVSVLFLQDVGSAILESYSRTLESLAYTVMSRIEDVLHADSLTQDPKQGDSLRMPSLTSDDTDTVVQDAKDEMGRLGRMEPVNSTLFDYVGPRDGTIETMILESQDPQGKKLSKVSKIGTKRYSYLDKLENLGGARSPISRH